MSIETKYVCDVCGAVRGETNHWFVANVGNAGYHVRPWGLAEAEDRLLYDDAKHLCGAQCIHALLDQFLTPKAA